MTKERKRPSWLRRLFRSTALGVAIFAGVTAGPPSLTNAFNQATIDYGDPDALRRTDHIPIRDGTVIGVDFPGVTSFQSILETGDIPSYPLFSLGNLYIGNLHIDWDEKDAFTETMASLKESVFASIEESWSLQQLLAQETWDRDDREMWERRISTIVSRAVAQTEGLDSYRTMDGEAIGTRRLNDLSEDIENGTATREFDCEAMSIVEGVLLQQIENHFLPAGKDSSGYKSVFNYYYARGHISISSSDKEAGGHAYIISSATGNIIEGTTEWSPYNFSAIPGYSFQDFVNGKPAINRDGSVYGGNITAEEAQEWREKVREQRRPPALTS